MAWLGEHLAPAQVLRQALYATLDDLGEDLVEPLHRRDEARRGGDHGPDDGVEDPRQDGPVAPSGIVLGDADEWTKLDADGEAEVAQT